MEAVWHTPGCVLGPLLGLPAAEIDRTLLPLAPTVVRPVVRRDAHAHVVAVIGQLVVKLPRLRVHPVQPIQAPANLVHDVRDAVGAGRPVRPVSVPEGLRVALEGIGHLVNGIGGGGGILEAVGGIVPAAPHVQVLVGWYTMMASFTWQLSLKKGFQPQRCCRI